MHSADIRPSASRSACVAGDDPKGITLAGTSWMRLMTDLESYFRVQVEAGDAGQVTLKVYGDLDIVSMAEFEAYLASRPVCDAREITFDISDTHFISAHAFATIGQCSLWAERVVVLSRTPLASKVLKACGYDRPVCIVLRD